MRLFSVRQVSPLAVSALFVPALVLSTGFARAQEYRGTISGQLTDQAGRLVRDAVVTARSTDQTYTSKSDSKGDYSIPFVQPGTYTVTVEAAGFGKQEQPGVIVDVSDKISANFTLAVGTINTAVDVKENALQLSTADASYGTVMDPEKIQNLPLNGRQIYQLLALTPGVRNSTVGFSGTRGWDVNNNYSIDGQPGSYTQFMLNGAPISVQGGGAAGTWTISPSVDAVQEFKVMTITFDSQYGRVGGGAVNTILKSGSPHFHGTLYDFWRNSALDANTYQLNQQGTAKPFHNEHQFGGTVGGPFLKHDAYFFFSYEGYRQVLPGSVVTTVPTADQFPGADGTVNLTNYLAATGRKNGIFDPLTTACAMQGANGCSTYGRTPFADNTIPANRISASGLAIMKLFPAPNRAGYINNYVFNGKDRYSYNMPIARVDYNFSEKTRLYGVFAYWAGNEYRNGNGLVGPAITGNINNQRSSLTQVLDLTHTFSPKIVGDVRLSYNRFYQIQPDGTVRVGLNTLTAGDLGLNMPQLPTTKNDFAPEISLGDNLPGVIGNTGDPFIFETYDLGPSVTQTLGKHALHYGAEFSLYHAISGGIGQPNGNFSFGTGFTQNNPFQSAQDGSVVADLLLGYPGGGSVQYSFAPYESYNYYGGYIQDDFKIKKNFTINAGLRWDEELSPKERHNRLLAGVCLTCPNPISSLINNPPNNTLPNGAPFVNPITGAVQFASDSYSAYANDTAYWQPKIGASWSPNRNFVIHGGYTMSKALGIELGGASAWSQTTNYQSSPDGGLHPYDSFLTGNPYPNGFITPPQTSQGPLTLVGTGFGIDQRNRKIPIVQQYTFGFETELPFQMVANVAYLGSHTFNLRASKQLNGISAADFAKGHADPNYLDQQVPNPFYGVLPKTVDEGANPTIQARMLMVPYPQYNGNLYSYDDASGYSNYNALLLKLEKRLSGNGLFIKGVSFLGSFTWSKLESATGFLNNNGASLVDPSPYYAIDGGDRPWDFAFSGLFGLPVGKGGLLFTSAHGPVGLAVNDWQLTWIFQNDGGYPIGYPSTYNYNCGGNYNIHPAQKSYKSYLNNSQTSCFSTFSEYTAVTKQPITSAIRQPWAQQTALGLQKQFAVREGLALNFKGEAFNLTNTPIFGAPSTGSPDQAITRNTSVSDPNQPGAWSGYGTIGSGQQNFPRQVQLSLKLQF